MCLWLHSTSKLLETRWDLDLVVFACFVGTSCCAHQYATLLIACATSAKHPDAKCDAGQLERCVLRRQAPWPFVSPAPKMSWGGSPSKVRFRFGMIWTCLLVLCGYESEECVCGYIARVSYWRQGGIWIWLFLRVLFAQVVVPTNTQRYCSRVPPPQSNPTQNVMRASWSVACSAGRRPGPLFRQPQKCRGEAAQAK